MKDLVILVPGKNEQFTLKGLLSRNQSLSIRKIEYEIFIHPNRDPGVYREAANFLRPLTRIYSHALVFLDREGSGQEAKTASEIERDIETRLEKNGWEKRAQAIVFDPELEIWAWVKSPHLAIQLGWENIETLFSFLRKRNYLFQDIEKPSRPKEAFEEALREKKIQRSSAIYKNIASKITFLSCQDRAFRKFSKILEEWFGEI